MADKTFLILGGYGSVGVSLAHLLLDQTDIRLLLAGRTLPRAEAKDGDWKKTSRID